MSGWISSENVFVAPTRKGETLPKLADLLKTELFVVLEEGESFSTRVCSQCWTKVRNCAAMLSQIIEKLNTPTDNEQLLRLKGMGKSLRSIICSLSTLNWLQCQGYFKPNINSLFIISIPRGFYSKTYGSKKYFCCLWNNCLVNALKDIFSETENNPNLSRIYLSAHFWNNTIPTWTESLALGK